MAQIFNLLVRCYPQTSRSGKNELRKISRLDAMISWLIVREHIVRVEFHLHQLTMEWHLLRMRRGNFWIEITNGNLADPCQECMNSFTYLHHSHDKNRSSTMAMFQLLFETLQLFSAYSRYECWNPRGNPAMDWLSKDRNNPHVRQRRYTTLSPGLHRRSPPQHSSVAGNLIGLNRRSSGRTTHLQNLGRNNPTCGNQHWTVTRRDHNMHLNLLWFPA